MFCPDIHHPCRNNGHEVKSADMKIAMFTDSYFPRINGISVSVHSYAEEFSKIGHEVCIVCLEYANGQQKSTFFDEMENDLKLPFKIIRVPSVTPVFSKEDRMIRLDKWRMLKKNMDAFKPDIVHINGDWSIGYFGAIYCIRRHIQFVYTFHTLWEDYLANYVMFFPSRVLKKFGRDVTRFYLKRAALIIAPTERIAEIAKSYGATANIRIIPTGIPNSKLEFSPEKSDFVCTKVFEKFPSLKGKRILLFVGRIAKEKNPAFLYGVLKKVQQEFKDTALLMIGGGPYLDELQELAEKQGVADSVFFTGYIHGNDLIYFYRLASVFVFPSKTETQGLVTAEAMLAGLPVVAIGEMGTVDVMQGDNGGFMVKDDEDEFAEKVSLLLRDDALHAQKSQEALAWGSQWKISSLAQNILECYREVNPNI